MLNLQTLSNLYEIPVVRSSTDKLHEIYVKAKDTSVFIRFPCNLVETVADKSLKMTFTLAEPLVKPFYGYVHVVDDYASEKLRQIESKYPVINTPTEEVVNKFNDKTECVRHVMNSVKDTTTSKIQHTKETVFEVATSTVQKASDAADSVYSFCETHIPAIQHLNGDKTKELREHAYSLYNYVFYQVQSSLLWSKILSVYSLYLKQNE